MSEINPVARKSHLIIWDVTLGEAGLHPRGFWQLHNGTEKQVLMAHPRLYKRVRPSGLVSSKAMIVVAPKTPSINCTLVDYSAGGACLEIFPMVQLPDRFELVYGSTRKRCRIVWRRGVRIGVTF